MSSNQSIKLKFITYYHEDANVIFGKSKMISHLIINTQTETIAIFCKFEHAFHPPLHQNSPISAQITKKKRRKKHP